MAPNAPNVRLDCIGATYCNGVTGAFAKAAKLR